MHFIKIKDIVDFSHANAAKYAWGLGDLCYQRGSVWEQLIFSTYHA
jgi:hypothetical protein